MLAAVFLSLVPLAMPDPAAPWELIEACPRLVIGTSKATAVVIGQKEGFAYMLTAHHAVAEDSPTQVQFFTRQSYPAPARTVHGCVVEKKFPQADFALLKVKAGDTPVTVLKLAQPTPRPRKVPFDAISIGCSMGEPPTGVREKVSAKRFGRREGGEQAFFWETELAPTPGRSGGPLVVGKQVVGICAAGKDGHGYYAHLDELLAGLSDEKYRWMWEEK